MTLTLNRLAFDEIAKLRPDLWSKVYPKRYNSIPNGYCSVKDIACTMLNCALKIENGWVGENERTEIVWASKLAKYRVPLYLLTRDITEALKQTTPPQIIELDDIKLPFEAAVFMLPQDALVNEDQLEGDALFISYVRTHLGEEIPSLAKGRPEVWVPQNNGTFTIFAGTRGEHLLHWSIPNVEYIDLRNLDRWVKTFENKQYHHESEAPHFIDERLSAADNSFMARVTHLVFGTLLLMTARPELIQAATLERRVQKKHDEVKEFWSPHVIGKNYHIQKEYIPKGGTHQRARMHFVRGAYRMQPCGEKSLQRRLIWVEPYVRCVDTNF